MNVNDLWAVIRVVCSASASRCLIAEASCQTGVDDTHGHYARFQIEIRHCYCSDFYELFGFGAALVTITVSVRKNEQLLAFFPELCEIVHFF